MGIIPIFTILILISILIGIAGIIFLIVGLINDNKKMWIPGAIGAGLAIILAASAFVVTVTRAVNYATDNIHKSFVDIEDAIEETDEGYYMDDYNYFLDMGFSYPKSEYFYICDNYCQTFLFESKELKEIILEEYSKEGTSKGGLAIKMSFYFEGDFEKLCLLRAYNKSKKLIGTTNVRVKGEKGNVEELIVDLSNIKGICNTKYFTIE